MRDVERSQPSWPQAPGGGGEVGGGGGGVGVVVVNVCVP